MVLRRPILLLLVAIFLAACGDGGPTGPGVNGGEPRTIKADPSFSSDIFEIFTRRGCTAGNCHGGGQGGLTMTSVATAYQNLVDAPVAGAGQAGEIRVIPGDAENSYLVKKLENRPGITGDQMPLGGAPLDDIDLTNIKNWINQGAKNN